MRLALCVLALLIISIKATEATDSITVAGHEIKVGDTFEFGLEGLDNIKSGVVQEVRCESNGTGLVILRVQDGRILEIEYSPRDSDCGGTRI